MSRPRGVRTGARIAGVEDDLGKALDRLPVGTFIRGVRPRIEGNEVDLGGQPLEQAHQRLRLGDGIVDRPSAITYSKVMRRAFDAPGYSRQALISASIGYLRLSGTSLSRRALLVACSETASIVPHSIPSRAISGTTPEVDTVMRRFDSDNPSPSSENSDGVAHGLEIVERLAHSHEDDVGHGPHAFAERHEPVGRRHAAGENRRAGSRATRTWPTISAAVRLRTSGIVPCGRTSN